MAVAPVPGERATKEAAAAVAELGVDQVARAIRSGDLDDELGDIIQAIRGRQESNAIELCWRITFDDLEITEEDLTVAEAKLVEASTGASMIGLPIAGSARTIAAVVAAALIERRGHTTDEAFKRVGSAGFKQLLASVSEYVVTGPPKESSASGTSAT